MKLFDLKSHDAIRQFPSLEVIVLASLWGLAHCSASVHVLKAFPCSQNGLVHCVGRVAWFGEGVP